MRKLINIRCSNLPRLAMCPGSLAAADGIESEDSAQSLAGTAGHAALEQYYNQRGHWEKGAACEPIDEFLTGLDDMTAGRARWYAKVMDEVIAEHGGAKKIYTEVEMGASLKNGFGVVELTGHADLIVCCIDGVTLISDWKFNFLEVPEAAGNIQLRGYAYLLVKDPNLQMLVGNEVHAILIAGGNENPFTAAVYLPDSMERAESHLFSIIRNALAPDARRVPSDDACKYCQAKCTTRCQETAELVQEDSSLALALRAAYLPECIADATKQALAAKQLKKLCEATIDNYNDFVRDNPELCEDYAELQKPRIVREIVDCQAAHDAVVTSALMTSEEFLKKCIKVPIGTLEKALKPALIERGEKVKDHKKLISYMLGDA